MKTYRYALGVAVLGFASALVQGNVLAAEKKVASKSAAKQKPAYTWVYVDDMHCAACAKKISRELYTVTGVVKVQTSLKKHFAVVTPQKKKEVVPRAVWEAVEEAGFKPVKLIGPSGIFVKKPPKVRANQVARKRATAKK